MPHTAALLLTDIVDSAALAQRLGDVAMARLWAAHDRLARELLRVWRGREIDKTDGFLLLFADARDALGYVLAYHHALARLDVPLKARAGLHVGEVTMRETPAADVLLGAKPVEVDGVSKPIAARVMNTALGGQTLITAAARWPARNEPANNQLFLPMAIGRIWFSIQLLSMGSRASCPNRVSASQRFKL